MRSQQDFDYETKRNDLIPYAEAVANERCGKNAVSYRGDVAAWGLDWNRVFHREMDRLASETGLLK